MLISWRLVNGTTLNVNSIKLICRRRRLRSGHLVAMLMDRDYHKEAF